MEQSENTKIEEEIPNKLNTNDFAKFNNITKKN